MAIYDTKPVMQIENNLVQDSFCRALVNKTNKSVKLAQLMKSIGINQIMHDNESDRDCKNQ